MIWSQIVMWRGDKNPDFIRLCQAISEVPAEKSVDSQICLLHQKGEELIKTWLARECRFLAAAEQ